MISMRAYRNLLFVCILLIAFSPSVVFAQNVRHDNLNGYGLFLKRYINGAKQTGVDWPGINGVSWGTRVQISNDAGNSDITLVAEYNYGTDKLLIEARKIASSLGYPNADYIITEGKKTTSVDIELNKYMTRTKKTSDFTLDLSRLTSAFKASQLSQPIVIGIDTENTGKATLSLNNKATPFDRFWFCAIDNIPNNSAIRFYTAFTLSSMLMPLFLIGMLLFASISMIVVAIRDRNKPFIKQHKNPEEVQQAYNKQIPGIVMLLPIFFIPAIFILLNKNGGSGVGFAAFAAMSPVSFMTIMMISMGLITCSVILNIVIMRRRLRLSEPEMQTKIKGDKPAMSWMIPLPITMGILFGIMVIPVANPDYMVWRAYIVWTIIAIGYTSCILLGIRDWKRTFTPIRDGENYNLVMELAAQANVKVKKVLLWKTSKANAFVTILSTVALSAGLVENFSADEIRAVIAHELGHIKLGHVKRTMITGGSVLLGIYAVYHFVIPQLTSHLDYTTRRLVNNPMLFVIPLNFLILALLSKGRRKREIEADKIAAEIIGDVDIVTNALKKLHEFNETPMYLKKSDEMINTHPSLAHRVEALSYNDANEEKLTGR